MNKRNLKVTFRVTESEKNLLIEKAKMAGLKMEPFLRNLIKGAEIKARPPNEYIALLKEINHIGNNINQIAHIANGEQHISLDTVKEVLSKQNSIVHLIRRLR